MSLRRHYKNKPKRWLNNIVLSVINTALVKLTIPLAGIAAAVLAGERQWGLLNNIVDSSGSINYLFEWFAIVIFLIIFDFTIYFQHRLFHAVPLLWRFHRMHHSDVDYDLTTGIRFHPISIVLSSIIKIALILIMGAPVFAVLLAEVLLNATSMFNHSNLKLPKRFESFLRKLIVTPDMHRIHHSVDNIVHNHSTVHKSTSRNRAGNNTNDHHGLTHSNTSNSKTKNRNNNDTSKCTAIIHGKPDTPDKHGNDVPKYEES